MINKWTAEEDNTLLANIKQYKKRMEAYAATSKMIGRSERACLDRWMTLKTIVDTPEIEQIIMNSAENVEETVENICKEEPTPQKVDIIHEIKKVIDESNLNKEENAKLKEINHKIDGENFTLQFELSQLKNKNEQIELQMQGLEQLIQKTTEEHFKYITDNEKLTNLYSEEVAKSTRLENKLKDDAALLNEYKRIIDVLKKEKAEAEQENSTIMNIFNKARKMFTGTDKEEKNKFKMDRNGNLERVL